MNHNSIYQFFVNEHKNNSVIQYPTDQAPIGLTLYNLGHLQRASVTSLRLNSYHKCQWELPHEVENEIVVSQAYDSKFFDNILYCGWLESKPNIIVLWTNPITSYIDEQRFLIQEMETVDPSLIRFSHSTVSTINNKETAIDLSFDITQYRPILVVKMDDGKLTTFDNRRLLRAQTDRIESIQCNVKQGTDTIPFEDTFKYQGQIVWYHTNSPGIVYTVDYFPTHFSALINTRCVINNDMDMMGEIGPPKVISSRVGFKYLKQIGHKEHTKMETIYKDLKSAIDDPWTKLFFIFKDSPRCYEIVNTDWWRAKIYTCSPVIVNASIITTSGVLEEWSDDDHDAFDDWLKSCETNRIVDEIEYAHTKDSPSLTDCFIPSDIKHETWEFNETDMIYIDDILSDVNNVNNVLLEKDEDFDPTGAIRKYRNLTEFKVMEALIDTVHILRSNCFNCNLNKTLSAELKCSMQLAIEAGLNTNNIPLHEALPINEWLPTMWLQVLGCPTYVHNCEDLLFIISTTIKNCTEQRTEENIVKRLHSVGFRKHFSMWIVSRLRLNVTQIDSDLRNIAKPISSNSFLIVEKNTVCYTSLIKKHNDGIDQYVTSEQVKQLQIKVGTSENLITPVLFQNEKNMNWYPIDFIKKVYEHMKYKLKNMKQQFCFYGHCTSESNAIMICQTGLSPYATYQNPVSCGHGMYFFKIDHHITSYSFEELNCDTSKDYGCSNDVFQIVLKQFRSFTYAMTRCFDVSKLDSLCPAVLLFFVPVNEIIEFDAVNHLLPLEEDDKLHALFRNTTGEITISTTSTTSTTSTNPLVSIGDIVCAVNMVNSNDLKRVEKINTLALLSGVVNFTSLNSDVFRANVVENVLRVKTLPIYTIKEWHIQSQLHLWKELINQDISEFHRLELWEYVFVSTTALQKLLEITLKHGTLEIVFVQPNVEHNEIHEQNTIYEERIESNIFQEEYVRYKVKHRESGDRIHPFWILH